MYSFSVALRFEQTKIQPKNPDRSSCPELLCLQAFSHRCCSMSGKAARDGKLVTVGGPDTKNENNIFVAAEVGELKFVGRIFGGNEYFVSVF